VSPTSGGAGGQGASGGVGGSGGSGGTMEGGAGGLALGGSGGAGGIEECVGVTTEAKKLPLDMYVIVDQSGSMLEQAGPKTRWQHVVDALTGFVSQSPATDGIGLALQYFPLTLVGDPCVACSDMACCQACGANSTSCINGVCTCSSTSAVSCNAGDYAAPEVPMTTLPAAAPLIVGSLAQHTPSGGTPTKPALAGALAYMQPWAAAHPLAKSVVVLATDGVPSGCVGNDIAAVAGLAGSAANANPPVLTFVVGVGSETQALDAVAQAGGTGSAFVVDVGGDVTQDFVDAMNAIREAVVACEYLIPEPADGSMVDFDLVNVSLTPSAGAPITVPQVGGEAACGAAGGWYYDAPVAPTKLLLCPATCDALEADAGAKLDVVLGCKTIVN
jgi:hypothetical protein